MRNSVVNGKLNHLRIHHDQLYVIRMCLIQDTHNQGVDANRFTGTSGTSDQHVRHLCDVRNHRLTCDVLTNCKGQFGIKLLKLLALQKVTQRNHHIFLVRDLNTNGSFSGDWRFNTNVRCRQIQLYVICKSNNFTYLDTLLRLKLIPCNTGALTDVRNRNVYAKGM